MLGAQTLVNNCSQKGVIVTKIYIRKIRTISFIASEKYFFLRYSVGHTDGQADPSYKEAFALENGNMFFKLVTPQRQTDGYQNPKLILYQLAGNS